MPEAPLTAKGPRQPLPWWCWVLIVLNIIFWGQAILRSL